MRRRKARPLGITEVENCSFPIMDFSSRRVILDKESVCLIASEYDSSLSCGSLAVIYVLSSSIPKNVKRKHGWTVLSLARGMFISLQILRKEESAC